MAPDGALSLNFGRIKDPIVDQNLADARTDPDPGQAARPQPRTSTPRWPRSATRSRSPTHCGARRPKLHGIGETVLPDGTKARDGAGFSGQFWVNPLWVDQG